MIGIMNSVIQTATRTEPATPPAPTPVREKRSHRVFRKPTPKVRDTPPHVLRFGRGYW